MQVALIFLCGACAGQTSEQAARDKALLDRVRTKIFTSNIPLSAEEKLIVSQVRPKIRLYRMAGDFDADYQFEWDLNGEVVVVRGRGSLVTLDHGEVRREQRAGVSQGK